MGRDGVVDTVVAVLTSLVAKKYGPRTKVALEALLSLTKASKINSFS